MNASILLAFIHTGNFHHHSESKVAGNLHNLHQLETNGTMCMHAHHACYMQGMAALTKLSTDCFILPLASETHGIAGTSYQAAVLVCSHERGTNLMWGPP